MQPDRLCYACARKPGAIARALRQLRVSAAPAPPPALPYEEAEGPTLCTSCGTTWTQHGVCQDCATAPTASPARRHRKKRVRCGNCNRQNHRSADCTNPPGDRRLALDAASRLLSGDAAEGQRLDEAAGGADPGEAAGPAPPQGAASTPSTSDDEDLEAVSEDELLLQWALVDGVRVLREVGSAPQPPAALLPGLPPPPCGQDTNGASMDLLSGDLPGDLAWWELPEPLLQAIPTRRCGTPGWTCRGRGNCRGRCRRDI